MRIMNFLILTLFLILGGCGGGSTTGNPVAPVTLRMVDKQPFAWFKKTLDTLISPAHSAVSNVKFCFKHLRMKPDSTTPGEDLALELGEVDINPNGTNLVTVSVPSGIYREVEFDLVKECDGVLGRKSVTITNNNGTFSTDESMTIKFVGTYTVTDAGTLTLNIDPLFDALELVATDVQIKNSLEDANGDF